MRSVSVPLLLALLAAPAATQASGLDARDLERCEAPYFLPDENEPGADRFPLESTEADVRINGVLAEVELRQRWRNAGERTLSARYVFPASTRAAVHGVDMELAGRTLRARIAERGAARAEYELARDEGRGATLLEQERPNVFRMEVANILPGETVEVVLRYSELLVPEEGVYEFVLPTVVGPRYTRGGRGSAGSTAWTANPTLHEGEPAPATFALQARLATPLPLAALECPSHEVHVSWTGPSSAEVRLAPAEARGADRDVVLRYRLAGARVATGLLLERAPGEEVGHFLLMVQPPASVGAADVLPREYDFVLDVSGSMDGQPLDVARRLLSEMIGGLLPSERFDILTFAGGSRVFSPAPVPATPENLELALEFLDAQDAGGGTELSAALARALRLPRTPGFARSLVVITDGFVDAEAEAFQLLHEGIGDANVFSFGIGSSVNRYLIEGLARVGQGEATVVAGGDPADALRRFRTYVSQPLLADVELESRGFLLLDHEPQHIAGLLTSRPIVVTGRWRGEPQGTLTLRGTGPGGVFRSTVDVAGVEPGTDGSLARLWARRRVAELSDWNFGQPSREQEQEILALGLEHELLTAHTSFVAVTQEVRSGVPGETVVQPLPLPRGVSDRAVGTPGFGTGSGDEPELLALVALATAAWLARGLLARGSRRAAA